MYVFVKVWEFQVGLLFVLSQAYGMGLQLQLWTAHLFSLVNHAQSAL